LCLFFKGIANPVARWIFQFFIGIHALLLPENQAIVLNTNFSHILLLALLGKNMRNYIHELANLVCEMWEII